MRSRSIASVLAIICLGVLCATLAAAQNADQAGKNIAGDWNGTLDVQGQKLRLALHLKKNPQGKLTGTLDSLDQGANDIPLSAVEQTGNDVKLELSGIGAGYQGKLNAAGTEITGEWKQGGATLPLVFKRAGDKTPGERKPKGLLATLAGFEDQTNQGPVPQIHVCARTIEAQSGMSTRSISGTPGSPFQRDRASESR